MRTPSPFRGAALAALLLSACSERGTIVSPAEHPGAATTLAVLDCTVRRQGEGGSLSCASAPEAGGPSRALMYGGQGTYVFLQADPASFGFLEGDNVLSFDVTVQNLLGQAIGTADGTTLDPTGVQVVFHTGPTGVPSGTVTLLDEDGTGDFLGSDEKYYQYDEIVQPSDVSEPKTWRFGMPDDQTGATFRVYIRTAVPHPGGYVDVTPPADSIDVAETTALSATVRTALGDVVPGQVVSWGSSDEGVATVDASGSVTGVGVGTATITATSGARSGSVTIAVCAAPAVGGVVTLEGADAASLCLSGGAGGAEYTVIPGNGADAGSLSLAAAGAGIVSVSGLPSPNRLWNGGRALGGRLAARVQDEAWETALRRRERAELPGLVSRARAAGLAGPGVRRAITPGVPAVGALMSLNVETDNSCATSDTRTGRVVAVSTRAVVVADTMNPAGGFTAAEYQAIADRFDALVYPTVTGAFGAHTDIDGNGRVVIFYTRAVNEMTPPGSGSYTGGFVFARDLIPVANCPSSNYGEMFYMLAPDPAGEVNGNVFAKNFVEGVTTGTLGHEYQHLINASRRIWINGAGTLESVWMDEGMAHVAEELLFYAASGRSARSNLGLAQVGDGGVVQSAFFEFMDSNLGRYRQFLLSPEAEGPSQSDDDLATRGAAWSFLRYAADRRGGTEATLWAAMANSEVAGNATLTETLGITETELRTWFRDWRTSAYADDAGIGAGALFTQPSWNLRSLYAALDYTGDGVAEGFQLAVRDPANGVAESFTLSPGSAAYLRMGVPAGAKAGLALLSGGAAPPASTTLQVIRRK